jgi:hypothetical protein
VPRLASLPPWVGDFLTADQVTAVEGEAMAPWVESRVLASWFQSHSP